MPHDETRSSSTDNSVPSPQDRPGGEIFDPLRMSPGQPGCIQWHSTSSLQQVLAQTDLYNLRYRNFSADNLKQVKQIDNDGDAAMRKKHLFLL